MRIFFLLVFFVMGFQSLHSQCDLDKKQSDFATGQSVSTKNVKIASVFPLIGNKQPWHLEMSFTVKDNTNYMLSVTHASQSYSDALSTIYFKFKDGSIIKIEEPFGTGEWDSGLGYSYTFTYFQLSKEEFLMFASQDLIKFQAVFSNNPDYPIVEEDLKKKIADRIRKDATCILHEIKQEVESGIVSKNQDESHNKVKCEYEIDKLDDFTKKRNVLTKPNIIYETKPDNGVGLFLNVCGASNDGKLGLYFTRCFYIKGSGATLNEEKSKATMNFNQLLIMLENDEIINLKEIETSEFLHRPTNVWSHKLFTIEEDSIWQNLKTVPIKKIRISMDDKELQTKDIDKEGATSIMKAIHCIDELNIPKPE